MQPTRSQPTSAIQHSKRPYGSPPHRSQPSPQRWKVRISILVKLWARSRSTTLHKRVMEPCTTATVLLGWSMLIMQVVLSEVWRLAVVLTLRCPWATISITEAVYGTDLRPIIEDMNYGRATEQRMAQCRSRTSTAEQVTVIPNN